MKLLLNGRCFLFLQPKCIPFARYLPWKILYLSKLPPHFRSWCCSVCNPFPGCSSCNTHIPRQVAMPRLSLKAGIWCRGQRSKIVIQCDTNVAVLLKLVTNWGFSNKIPGEHYWVELAISAAGKLVPTTCTHILIILDCSHVAKSAPTGSWLWLWSAAERSIFHSIYLSGWLAVYLSIYLPTYLNLSKTIQFYPNLSKSIYINLSI